MRPLIHMAITIGTLRWLHSEEAEPSRLTKTGSRHGPTTPMSECLSPFCPSTIRFLSASIGMKIRFSTARLHLLPPEDKPRIAQDLICLSLRLWSLRTTQRLLRIPKSLRRFISARTFAIRHCSSPLYVPMSRDALPLPLRLPTCSPVGISRAWPTPKTSSMAA